MATRGFDPVRLGSWLGLFLLSALAWLGILRVGALLLWSGR